ncbi:MAG: multicopper oxidase domain-containing protein [Ilumatobacteraceae bacterium]
MAREEKTVLGWLAFVVAAVALFMSLFAMRDSGTSAGGAGTPSGGGAVAALPTVTVTMSEFKFDPSTVSIPSGGAILRVVNAGSTVHTLDVVELGKKTGDVQPGASADLTLTGAADGHYTIICDIAGHAGAGMTGSLMVGGAATGDGTATTDPHGTMTWQEMDAQMNKRSLEFSFDTKALGGQDLAPTILADGTKQFDLTAEIVKWEVEPGKIVDAWTYNGVVPAPVIHVQTGDKVQVVLHNKLPESTVIHFHGIKVPNEMDGVDPFTQDAIQPGTTFTYAFTADGPAVGIYHSHHNGHNQVTNGLFGAFLIDEMPIPKKLVDKGYTKVDKKVNMVLNDAGTIGLTLNGKSFPATEGYTLKVGQVMEVNYFNEGLMAHPMHLHQPIGWIIAKDGVPLDEPFPGDTINVAPGERYTVLYKAEIPGIWAWHCHILTHAEGPQGMFGMVTALKVD